MEELGFGQPPSVTEGYYAPPRPPSLMQYFFLRVLGAQEGFFQATEAIVIDIGAPVNS